MKLKSKKYLILVILLLLGCIVLYFVPKELGSIIFKNNIDKAIDSVKITYLHWDNDDSKITNLDVEDSIIINRLVEELSTMKVRNRIITSPLNRDDFYQIWVRSKNSKDGLGGYIYISENTEINIDISYLNEKNKCWDIDKKFRVVDEKDLIILRESVTKMKKMQENKLDN